MNIVFVRAAVSFLVIFEDDRMHFMEIRLQ